MAQSRRDNWVASGVAGLKIESNIPGGKSGMATRTGRVASSFTIGAWA